MSARDTLGTTLIYQRTTPWFINKTWQPHSCKSNTESSHTHTHRDYPSLPPTEDRQRAYNGNKGGKLGRHGTAVRVIVSKRKSVSCDLMERRMLAGTSWQSPGNSCNRFSHKVPSASSYSWTATLAPPYFHFIRSAALPLVTQLHHVWRNKDY